MKFCPNCGSAIDNDSKFCKYCGCSILLSSTKSNQKSNTFSYNKNNANNRKGESKSWPTLGIASIVVIFTTILIILCLPSIGYRTDYVVYKVEMTLRIIIVISAAIFTCIPIFISKNVVSKTISIFCFIIILFVAINYVPYAINLIDSKIWNSVLIPALYDFNSALV